MLSKPTRKIHHDLAAVGAILSEPFTNGDLCAALLQRWPDRDRFVRKGGVASALLDWRLHAWVKRIERNGKSAYIRTARFGQPITKRNFGTIGSDE